MEATWRRTSPSRWRGDAGRPSLGVGRAYEADEFRPGAESATRLSSPRSRWRWSEQRGDRSAGAWGVVERVACRGEAAANLDVAARNVAEPGSVCEVWPRRPADRQEGAPVQHNTGPTRFATTFGSAPWSCSAKSQPCRRARPGRLCAARGARGRDRSGSGSRRPSGIDSVVRAYPPCLASRDDHEASRPDKRPAADSSARAPCSAAARPGTRRRPAGRDGAHADQRVEARVLVLLG